VNLPPVKIHCSVLAEDAIKSAIADYRKKQAERRAIQGGAVGGVVTSAEGERANAE
jgi:nitrogen fixation NifU-like protein